MFLLFFSLHLIAARLIVWLFVCLFVCFVCLFVVALAIAVLDSVWLSVIVYLKTRWSCSSARGSQQCVAVCTFRTVSYISHRPSKSIVLSTVNIIHFHGNNLESTPPQSLPPHSFTAPAGADFCPLLQPKNGGATACHLSLPKRTLRTLHCWGERRSHGPGKDGQHGSWWCGLQPRWPGFGFVKGQSWRQVHRKLGFKIALPCFGLYSHPHVQPGFASDFWTSYPVRFSHEPWVIWTCSEINSQEATPISTL